jgi:pyruvate,orthophosphate dikinase
MPGVADELTVLMALRVQGIATPERLATAVGEDASATVAQLVADGFASERTGRLAGFSLTPQGIERLDKLLADEGLRTNEDLKDCYDTFLSINNRVLKISSDWQVRDGVPNDHSDSIYDEEVIERLAGLHERVGNCMTKLGACAPRFAPYAARFGSCVERLQAGDHSAFTAPLAESYHTVWFELHQDFLLTLGLERET